MKVKISLSAMLLMIVKAYRRVILPINRNKLPSPLRVTFLFGFMAINFMQQSNAQNEVFEKTRIMPEKIYQEFRRLSSRLNFDVEMINRSDKALTITGIELRAFDDEGRFLTRFEMGSNGLPGPITTLPEREVAAGGLFYLFNPFPDLPTRKRIGEVKLTIGHTAGVSYVSIPVHPIPDRTLRRFPIDGVAFVFAGSQFFSHHRRVSLASEQAKALGLKHNSQRYALDLTVVDPKSGNLARSPFVDGDSFFASGAVVRSPADGVVVGVRNNMDDNEYDESRDRIPPLNYEDFGESASLGNYILLRIDGAFLMMSHFQKGSIEVELNSTVRAGDMLGRIGLSGDTAYPHLHMQLQDKVDVFSARPLPIVFECLEYVTETNDRKHYKVTPDSGELVVGCS